MRYIGNKEKLLNDIYNVIQKLWVTWWSFCDFFSWTGNVWKFFKSKWFKIISSDLLYSSYVLQKAYIYNNEIPKFDNLLKNINIKNESLFFDPFNLVIEYLNNLKWTEWFIYKNYTEEWTQWTTFVRKYFIGENGKKIDDIRSTIEEWKVRELISENEYFILLACLLEAVPFFANISWVYWAFLKTYDPRALKPLKIKTIELINGKHENEVFNINSMNLIDGLNVDILYLDPPYNERQYLPNYHLPETIAKHDNPEIKWVTWMRANYKEQKSEFCNKNTALLALDKIADNSRYEYLILSYNTEGIMPQEDITKTLEKYWNLNIVNIDYKRFKSNNNWDSKHKKMIHEQLYILKSNRNR